MSMIDDAVNLWNVGNESKQEMKAELVALRRDAKRWQKSLELATDAEAWTVAIDRLIEEDREIEKEQGQ